MRILKYSFLLLLGLLAACEEEEATFGELVAPSNLQLNAEIVGADANTPNGDGSGLVNFSVTADDAISYKINFGDGREEVTSTGTIQHQYVQVGLNTYTVTVVANGTGGLTSSMSMNVDVFSAFEDPTAEQFLTGGSSKTWYWSAAETGHLGVGPNDGGPNSTFPQFYQAVPFEKDGADESLCLYMDQMTFTQEGDQIFYELNNFGQTYFNVAYEGVVGGTNGFDFCYDFNTEGQKLLTLAPSTSGLPEEATRGTDILLSNDGFFSYYIGTSQFEILEITENRMRLRAIQGNNDFLAWYFIFTTTPPGEDSGLDMEYENLVFEDDFDSPGAPDPAIWTYDIGTGQNGWGNGESQYYTDRPENIIIEDGFLKITAQRENFQGSEYTSARLKSEDLFEFTYGRVDIRAKMPSGGGIWPALWMLGGNFAEVSWPACGEIDIMEYADNNPGVVHGSVHSPSSFGATVNTKTTSVPEATSAFHVYSVNWSPNQISFLVDDQIYYTYSPAIQDADTWPFNQDFFLIMNVAIGGTFGGEIDPNFQEGTIEVDWVRVYQ